MAAETQVRQGVYEPEKEIYTYTAPWPLYSMNWCNNPDPKFQFRLALGSFLEEYRNKVHIIQLSSESGEFELVGEFEHPYPTTRILWQPKKGCSATKDDIVATSGDYLRLWSVGERKTKLKCLLNNNKNSEFCAPLTAFDWNMSDPHLIGTASIDTTCTIWDVQEETVKTQLIAHDKEVYDIAFRKGVNIFASCGADGSVRMFDLRSLDHSTVIYETQDLVPLLRLVWNKQDMNYIACIEKDTNSIAILDIRHPSMPVGTLQGHSACVNSLSWAPHSSCHICSGGDDSQALIWDISSMPKPVEDPILAYKAEGAVNTLSWSSVAHDWVSITFDKKCQVLRV